MPCAAYVLFHSDFLRRHGECPHCFALLPRAPLAFHRGFLPVQSGLRHRFGGGTSDIAHTGAGVSLRCGHVTDVTVIPEYPPEYNPRISSPPCRMLLCTLRLPSFRPQPCASHASTNQNRGPNFQNVAANLGNI